MRSFVRRTKADMASACRRPAEQVTLGEARAHAQEIELLLVLDALGDD